MLKPLIYADLVGLSADEAKAALLTVVADGRPKPSQPPAFPGTYRAVTKQAAVPFPGVPASVERSGRGGALNVWREKLDFLLEQEPVIVDLEQQFALRKQIEKARKKIQELGG